MSRTLRSTFALALPIVFCVPLALGACNVTSSFTPEPPGDPVVDPPKEDQVFTSKNSPPPISGGSLVALKDGVTALAADPDRDRLWVVDTAKLALRGSIALEAGDEPGRGVEDGAGRVWVALRRGGAVVAVDVAALSIAERVPVCAEPRGLAYDAATDRIHVACSGGELVSLAAKTGAEVRRLHLDRDLRDVLVDGQGLRVSRFRSAELLSVDAAGGVAGRVKPPVDTNQIDPFEASVAWRTVALPNGGVATLHQRSLAGVVPDAINAYYSNPCTVIVKTAVTVDDPGAPQSPLAGGLQVALAVDLAIAPDGQRVAVAAAGERVVVETTLATLRDDDATQNCVVGAASSSATTTTTPIGGTPIAVAYDLDGHLLVQSREPASVWVFGRGQIPLPGESRRDSGHDLFHSAPPAGVACASCHPEGREDGRVWEFDGKGKRRTQSVAGGVLETGPLHWTGELADFNALVGEVLVNRMQHAQPGPDHVKAFASWLDTIPAPAASPTLDAAAVAKGEALFHDEKIGCATCHTGPKLTTGATADVGTGAKFKIPALVGVAARAPFMHDGCAATLADRFGKCGGSEHGATASLTATQVSDLVAYMETL